MLRVAISLTLLATLLAWQAGKLPMPQVNSPAPQQIDLPAPLHGAMSRGGPKNDSLGPKSTRCYTKPEMPKPKGCIYPEPHDVQELCVCSLDGGEVPGQFLQ